MKSDTNEHGTGRQKPTYDLGRVLGLQDARTQQMSRFLLILRCCIRQHCGQQFTFAAHRLLLTLHWPLFGIVYSTKYNRRDPLCWWRRLLFAQ